MAKGNCDTVPNNIDEARGAIGRWVQVRHRGEGGRELLLWGVLESVQGEADSWGRVRLDLRQDVPGLARVLVLDLDAGWSLWEIGAEAASVVALA